MKIPSQTTSLLKKVAKGRKIVLSGRAVHIIVYRDKAHVVARKDQFRVVSHLQVVPPEAAHVLDDERPHKAPLHEGESLLNPRTVKIRPGVAVIDQYAQILESALRRVFREDGFLIGVSQEVGR